MDDYIRLAFVIGLFTAISVGTYSCSQYNITAEQEKTKQLQICMSSGGKIHKGWGPNTYCKSE